MYEHIEPPVADVTMDAYAFPLAMAQNMLMASWNNSFTEVMHLLSALTLYREAAYGEHSDWPDHWVTVETVITFAQKHPMINGDRADVFYFEGEEVTKEEYRKQLCVKLLDALHFFKELSPDD